MIGKIQGTGAYVPPKILENQQLEKWVETNDTWIRERTGVQRRHVVAKPEESTAFLATQAARQALKEARIKPEELDLILVSTVSADQMMPGTACLVQKELGAVRAAAFDLNAACSGFLVSYITACAYIESGLYQKILIIGSETLSNIVDWKDRGTCILFGDGAGAVVLTAEEERIGERNYRPVLHSDGNQGQALTLRSRYFSNPFKEQKISEKDYVQMDGQAVFKFAVRKVPEVIEEVLKQNQVKKEEIKYYVLHQANLRIIEQVAKRLKEPMEKFPVNLQEYGNTSSASLPILLHELNRDGRLKSGDRILLAGFGGGLTWGAAILKW
nr:beta-ketoacyl-ACP synthase III [uncultured Mediterraneibacter sp.]